MATSSGQYTPVFSPGEPPSLKGKNIDRPQSTGSQSWTLLKQLCTHRHKALFAGYSSAPGRVEREGGAVAWFVGTLVAPGVQGRGQPLPQELWPLSESFFEPLVARDQKASLASLSP